MKEAVIYYWSDICDRKAMAEAAAQEVREVYAKLRIKEGDPERKKAGLKAAVGNNPASLLASYDLWRDGQWVRYWEERIKSLGGEVRPGAVSLKERTVDGMSGCNQQGKKLGDYEF